MNFKFDQQKKIKKYESFSLEEVYEERKRKCVGNRERVDREINVRDLDMIGGETYMFNRRIQFCENEN